MRSDFGLKNGKSTMPRVSSLLSGGMLAAVLMASLCGQAQRQNSFAQETSVDAHDDGCGISFLPPCLQRMGQDEAGILRSVYRPTRHSLPVILGVAASTGVALHFDKQMSKTLMGLPENPAQVNRAADITGIYGPFAAGGLMYLTGTALNNSHARETGMLATEAMLDGVLIGQGLKFAVNRQSPGTAPQAQEFYASGVPRGGSMPSAHAINAWAFATVLAGESHSKWVGVLAYSLATTVSFSRTVTGAHSVSDAIVGSAIGFGIGEYVLHRRSTEWRTADSKHPSMIPSRNDGVNSSAIKRDTPAPAALTVPQPAGVPQAGLLTAQPLPLPAVSPEVAVPLVSEVEYPGMN